MGVTPSAISHQIRGLEAALGTALFVRGVRSVTLTAQGAALYAEIHAGFARIEQALARTRAGARQQIKVSALAFFTQYWLAPRLADFEAAHPNIAIAIDTTNRLADFESDGVDVAIRNSEAAAPGLIARKLLDVRPLVLCAPSLALRTPDDLARCTLIQIAPRADAWARWLDAAGLRGLAPRRMLSFDSMPAALEAAAAGHGVALVWDPLAWDAPMAARLVCPFASPQGIGAAYFLVYPRRNRDQPAVAAFTAWIVAAMAKDKKRLARLARAHAAQHAT